MNRINSESSTNKNEVPPASRARWFNNLHGLLECTQKSIAMKWSVYELVVVFMETVSEAKPAKSRKTEIVPHSYIN